MGLDMYLNRVPKCNNLEELKSINDRIDNAFINGNLGEELKTIKKEKEYIYDIEMKPDYMVMNNIEEWKKDKEGWGNIFNLEIRTAYWRKFNALHNWFVENVQDGEDDCGNYIVSEEKLKELFETISELTPENAADKLPTKSGFFFGGTDIDDWYWKKVESLKNTLGHLLSQDFHGTMYVYSSSW